MILTDFGWITVENQKTLDNCLVLVSDFLGIHAYNQARDWGEEFRCSQGNVICKLYCSHLGVYISSWSLFAILYSHHSLLSVIRRYVQYQSVPYEDKLTVLDVHYNLIYLWRMLCWSILLMLRIHINFVFYNLFA